MMLCRRLDRPNFLTAKTNNSQSPGAVQTRAGQKCRNAGARGQVRWLIQEVHGDTRRGSDRKRETGALHAIKFGDTHLGCLGRVGFAGFSWQVLVRGLP